MNGYIAPYKSRAEIHTPKLRGDKRKAVFLAFDEMAAQNPDTLLLLYEDSAMLIVRGGWLAGKDALEEALDDPKQFLADGGALSRRIHEVEGRLGEIESEIDDLEGEKYELENELQSLKRKKLKFQTTKEG